MIASMVSGLRKTLMAAGVIAMGITLAAPLWRPDLLWPLLGGFLIALAVAGGSSYVKHRDENPWALPLDVRLLRRGLRAVAGLGAILAVPALVIYSQGGEQVRLIHAGVMVPAFLLVTGLRVGLANRHPVPGIDYL